jgi:hypothetical protein
MDAAGVTWAGMEADPLDSDPVAELWFSASGVTARPEVEDGDGGVAAEAVDAGSGAAEGSFDTVIGVTGEGPAGPDAGRTGLMSISSVIDPLGAEAVSLALVTAVFAAGAAASCTV